METAGIVDGPAGLDAEQYFVSFALFPCQVVAVVGSYQGDPGLLGNFNETLIDRGLDRDAVFLDFEV